MVQMRYPLDGGHNEKKEKNSYTFHPWGFTCSCCGGCQEVQMRPGTNA